MKVVAIIQTRSRSTRLPGKILLSLPYGSELTVLDQVIQRARAAHKLDLTVVATTESKEDERIIRIAEHNKVSWFRGSEDDVLSRYYYAARESAADVVVRITSDCPCLDPQVIDQAIELFREKGIDYLSNTLERTFPHGLDVEVFSFEALERAFNEASSPAEREHVTLYWRKSGLFKIANFNAPLELTAPEIRITVDTEEDYALLCCVFDFLYAEQSLFGLREIVALFREKPWLRFVNQRVTQKQVFDTLQAELREGVRILKLQDLHRAAAFIEEKLPQLNDAKE